MDDNIRSIAPTLHFPIGKVFEITDQFNGPVRGTFWYRTQNGTLRGPYKDADGAAFYMEREASDDCA